MANEVTWSVVEGILGYDYALFVENMVSALYAYNNVLDTTWQKSIAGFPSESDRFPRPPKLTATSIGDGTDLTNTAFTPTQVTLTTGEVGLMVTVTDHSRSSQIVDLDFYAEELGKAVAEKLTTDICGLGSGFSSSVGSTTVDLTEQNFMDAKTTLENNDARGPFAAILYTQQHQDLIRDIGTQINAAGTTGTSPRAVLNDLVGTPGGMAGTLYDVDVRINTTVPTANAGADSAGFMFSKRRAVGYVEKHAIRPELERDASFRGTEIVVTADYAVGEIDDDSGVGIITDR